MVLMIFFAYPGVQRVQKIPWQVLRPGGQNSTYTGEMGLNITSKYYVSRLLHKLNNKLAFDNNGD